MYVFCVIVMTVGEIGNTPTGQAVSARLSPDRLRGRYQGVYQLSWTLAQVVAPLVGGAVIGTYGGTPLWIGSFAVTAVAALAFLRIGRRVERRVAIASAAERPTAQPGTSPGDSVAQGGETDGQRPELATA
jgi:MFS family permease